SGRAASPAACPLTGAFPAAGRANVVRALRFLSPGGLWHHDREAPGPLPPVPTPLSPAAPRLAGRGAGDRLLLRAHALPGEHARGVGPPSPPRPGAHPSPVRPAGGEPGDAAARGRLRRVRPAGARQQHRDLPDRRPVAAGAPAPGTLAGGPPGAAPGPEEPEELASVAHPVAFPPGADLPGLHVGGVG